jgi:hypothetical protein
MKNVIKFPIENTRKDLLSNKETEDQLRLNKLDFVTEITAHYGTLIYNKLSMHGFDTNTKEFAKDYYFMTNALKSALFRSVGLKDDMQEIVDKHPEYEQFVESLPEEFDE